MTLAPSLTELVYAAGAGDMLIGVSEYSDFPDAARLLPRVADAGGISWESLLALNPDLVLAWKGGTRDADIARLVALGINVSTIEISALDDIARGIRLIGKLTGRKQTAESAALALQAKLTKLRDDNAAKARLKVFFAIASKPLMTVNRKHVISEMIGLCGGNNVFLDAPTLVSEPSREVLLSRQPDVILHGVSSISSAGPDAANFLGVPASTEGRTYGILADHVFRPGPRSLLATQEICSALDRGRENLKAQKTR